MFARVRDFSKKHRQRLTYLLTAAVLALLLEVGHVTQWSFGHSAKAGGISISEPAEPAAVANSVPLAAEVVAKIGIVVEPAVSKPMRQTISVNGVTAYDEDAVAQLSVRVPGHVWRVEKRAGQEIKKGDCLAIIDAVAVGEAKSAFLQALVDEELKRKTFERMSKLSGEVAERSLLQSDADWREAHIHLLSSQQKLVNLGMSLTLAEVAEFDVDELARRVQLLGLPESIRSQLDPVSTTANLIPLTAPFDGIVVSREASLGEIVTPEKAQFVVADVSRMWILLDLRKEAGDQVRLGQPIEFLVDGAVVPVEGKIDWISTELDRQTRTLRVRADVENPRIDEDSSLAGARRLKANTFGVGRIVLRESPSAIAVTSAAVQSDASGTFVFVREGGSFVRRNVSTGAVDRDFVEIVSGLRVGEIVAGKGSHVLKAQLGAKTAP